MAVYARYIAIVLLALAAGLVLDALAAERHRASERLTVTRVATAVAAAVERELAEKILVTEGIAAAFLADPDLPEARFERMVRQLARGEDDILNVAAAPGLVIEYVYPRGRNSSALGLDLRTRPDFMQGVDQAIRSGRPVVTGPFDLVQGGQGFITRSAVRDPEAAPDVPPWGITSVVMDARIFFEVAGIANALAEADLEVRNAEDVLLFGSGVARDANPVVVPIEVPGTTWTVSAIPPGGWAKLSPFSHWIWAVVAAATVALLTLIWAFGRKEQAETQLVEAINALEDAFALFDADDRLVIFNQKYKEFYAASADAIFVGARFEDIIRHGVAAGQYVDAIGREEEWIAERLRHHAEPPDGPIEQYLPNGRWSRVLERRTPSGNIAGFRIDITDHKEALKRSEAANAAKTAFINTVSHELRTPLTVMLGYNAFLGNVDRLPSFSALTRSLEAGDADAAQRAFAALREELRRYSDQIGKSGQHLMHLVSGILDVARIDAGTFKLCPEIVDLGPLTRDVVQQFRPIAERKRVRLEVDADCAEVVADPTRVRQILFNLVDNALKFTEAGSVTVRLRNRGDRVLVEVADTGCGISPENVARIFERFGQVDSSDNRRHGGVGLGLAIARDLAEMQGGTLGVNSVPGEGSVFRLSFERLERARIAAA